MYGTPGSEIPSVGKVDMTWIQTPLPPVNLATLKVAPIAGQQDSGNGAHSPPAEDVQMGDEGNAMARGTSPARGHERNEHQNLDYDVADDEWS